MRAIVQEPLPWAKKHDARLLWRGEPSGVYHIDAVEWRRGQRDRLSFFADDFRRGQEYVLIDNGIGSKTSVQKRNITDLVKDHLNIGVIDAVRRIPRFDSDRRRLNGM